MELLEAAFALIHNNHFTPVLFWGAILLGIASLIDLCLKRRRERRQKQQKPQNQQKRLTGVDRGNNPLR